MLLSLLVLCTSHGCCVKVTGIAPYIPLCHHPFYESVTLCSLSCIPQFQRCQAAPVLPLVLSQPVHNPKKWELAQLVRSLHHLADHSSGYRLKFERFLFLTGLARVWRPVHCKGHCTYQVVHSNFHRIRSCLLHPIVSHSS